MSRVRHSLARTEATFHRALVAAKARGELLPDADAKALASFLTAGFQGLRLVGKVTQDRNVLRGIALVMLRCLDERELSDDYGMSSP